VLRSLSFVEVLNSVVQPLWSVADWMVVSVGSALIWRIWVLMMD